MLKYCILQADATLEMEQRDFARAALEYVCLIQEVQERKKFEFVETVSEYLAFLYLTNVLFTTELHHQVHFYKSSQTCSIHNIKYAAAVIHN